MSVGPSVGRLFGRPNEQKYRHPSGYTLRLTSRERERDILTSRGTSFESHEHLMCALGRSNSDTNLCRKYAHKHLH